MTNKIKVFFIIPTLFAGGAERVMSYVSQNIDKKKFDCSLVVLGFEKNSKYKITEIPVIYLNKDRVLTSVIPLILLFRREKPKIAISAISHLNINMGLISILFPKIKFIGRHTIVSQSKSNYKKNKKNSTRRKLIKYFEFGYNFLDIILCQSKDMYYDVKRIYNFPEDKLKVINNPITDDFKIKKQVEQKEGLIKFITVAQINKRKGHKRILNALSKLNFPFQYTIIGNGPEKESLFKLIKDLKIEDKVIHIPFTNEVSKFLSANDFYLMGSYSEGFPNCLLESCSVGTPIIAYNAPGGLNEIIEDGINGYLVDTEEEFVEKLKENRTWDPSTVRNSVLKKFNKEKILKEYEDLFLEVLNEN